jgi:hypothetical protein
LKLSALYGTRARLRVEKRPEASIRDYTEALKLLDVDANTARLADPGELPKLLLGRADANKVLGRWKEV